MNIDRKSKDVRKTSRFSPGCLVALGVMLGCFMSLLLAELRYGGSPFAREDPLRLVMDTYYFGNGLADLTGNTSVLKNVVTERDLRSKIDHCNKGHCNGSYPPHVIGEYFKVVKQTDEFAVVELSHRPLITDLDEIRGGYLTWCYLLVRDGNDWRVDSMYYDCDGYLRQLSK